jgi:hypothetical protein
MNGRRCKALKRAFAKENGRPPSMMEVIKYGKGGSVTYKTSEWRQVKKAYGKVRRGW